jgi:UDP-GlcNAc:undecaprenyl-phosphate GlcNAc-1-phosphate transferase
MSSMSPLERDGLLFVVTMAGTAVATPLVIQLALRIGLVDRPAPHKFHQRPTPYLGGLSVALSVLAAMVALLVTEPQLRLQFSAIAAGGVAVSAIGLLDDWATVRPLPRLAVQGIAALGLWAAGIRLGPTGVEPIDLCATVFVVLAVTNAVNLLDNMDGLSTGAVAVASLFAFVAAYWQGQTLVSAMAIVLAGACLGFLPYNFNPARIFLGDAGTLFMGFLLATTVIELDLAGYPTVTRAAVPMTIIAVPLFDMALVVVSRRRGGRAVFRGGTDHSSHRLVALGLTASQAALVTYGASGIAGMIALALLRARDARLTWVVLAAGSAFALWLIAKFEGVAYSPRKPSAAPAEASAAIFMGFKQHRPVGRQNPNTGVNP